MDGEAEATALETKGERVKVLITGGSGFIARYFHELFTPRGVEISILDLVKPEWDIGRAAFHQGDVRDPAAVRKAMQGCDAVLNLAAAHHDFGIEHDTYYDVNERGSKAVCDAMDELNIRKACFYSTVAVYGSAPEPHHEDAPTNPSSPYGGSKLAGEKVFAAWASKGEGRTCLVIRPTVTFGPRNFANMYSLIRQIYSGKYFQVGPGTNIKSLSYVENIVAATAYLWDRPGAKPFEVFNYIDKPDLTSRQIGETIYAALDRRPPGFAVPMWLAMLGGLPFDIVIALTGKNLPISTARIKKLFSTQTKFEADKVAAAGFKAAIPLAEGIKRMTQWYAREGKDQRPVWHTPPAKVGGALVATDKAGGA